MQINKTGQNDAEGLAQTFVPGGTGLFMSSRSTATARVLFSVHHGPTGTPAGTTSSSVFPREYLQYHQYPAWGDVLGSGFEIEGNPRSSRRYCRRLRENKENSSQDRSLRTSPLSRASRDAAAIALQCRHDWRKYPARVSHPSRRMRQRFKLRSTSSSFSPVEIKAKIGDRNIRNTLLAGAACLLSLALGGRPRTPVQEISQPSGL
jgi:hypothetical protein